MTKHAMGLEHNERRAYGIREVAESMGVSVGFVRLEIARGRLPSVRLGRRRLIAASALDEYIAGARASAE
jgi:excisionase family DNA binding protein